MAARAVAKLPAHRHVDADCSHARITGNTAGCVLLLYRVCWLCAAIVPCVLVVCCYCAVCAQGAKEEPALGFDRQYQWVMRAVQVTTQARALLLCVFEGEGGGGAFCLCTGLMSSCLRD